MATELRKTGIGVVGDKPWGTHFCHFYDTKEDLLDILVRYFKAGLEDKEFCVWVVSEPLTEQEAWNALRDAVPELDRYVSDRSIEILLGRDWYLKEGKFDLKRVTNACNEKLNQALARGYAGMRVSGNTAWLEKKDWKDFCEYEQELNDTVTGQRMTVLCTYPLGASAASELLDVVSTHQFAITKRKGAWEIIETRELKQAKAEIKKLHEELEQRVVERTEQLEAANVKLRDEIAHRKRAEEKLRQSAEHFRLLVEQVEDYAIFSLDPEGRVSSWNAGAEHIKGYRAHEIIGQHISRFYPREDVERGIPEMGLRAAATEGRFEYEGWRVRKDGSRFWANVVITALRDHQAKLVGFSKITRDLTERKRAEEALRESEKQLRLAQDASGSGVWDWNPLTDTATWSDEHFRIFGLEPNSRKFSWAAFLALVHPDDIAKLESAVREALKPNGELEAEYRILRPDGQVRWVMSKGQTHCDFAGQPIRMIGLTMDITDRKQLEQALLKTQAELAHLSRVMTMGELTGAIAHEVNQPLTAVVTNGDACLRWLDSDPPNLGKARESVAGIIRESNRASEVIRRVRALVKNTTPQKTTLDVNELIGEVIGMVGAELAENHVSLQTELAPHLPEVSGDRIQLQQVILNLIANGIEAMNVVTERARELSISSKATHEDGVLISICDCGTGLVPESADHLFESFFTTKQQGMGLGLSISRTIVEAHGGRLWAMPNSGPGATFQFTLPKVARASA